MGEIQKAYITPHPPIIIPEVGKGREQDAAATIEAYDLVGRQIRDLAPQVIIITTPHGTVYENYIHISLEEKLIGSFKDFGAPEVQIEIKNDIELVDKIIGFAQICGIDSGGLGVQENNLDHGALVPLYYITKYYTDFSLIRISISDLPFEQLYIFGHCIQKAVAQSNRKVVFVGSGDLSHKLSNDGPYGYAEQGPLFDHLFNQIIIAADFRKLLNMDEDLCRAAGECGLRSFVMMAGALNGFNIKSNILSYECPFGIGYMVAEFSIDGRDLSRDLISFYDCKRTCELEATRKAEDPYVNLARLTLEHYIKTGKVIDIPDYMPDEMFKRQAGVFISLKKQGQLRGCIGTIFPVTDSIAEEIIQNAISSGTRDPRFNPIKDFELNRLVYSVDVLGEPESIRGIEELDILRYGIIVKAGYRRGILLPDLEGVETTEQQVNIALSKAGIHKDESYLMERFEVIRHR